MKQYELYKMTTNQVMQGNFDKVALALGSCESHGLHLPEGTDTLVAYKLACQVAEKVDGLLVLPPVTVGYSRHYDTFPFSLSLSYDTMIDVIFDLLVSVLDNGIRNILIVNGHDGNIAAIEVASRKIKEKYPQARIAAFPTWWVTAGELLPEGTFEVWDGLGHAGEGESSIAYYLFPEWCEPELARRVIPDNLPANLDIKWDFAEITDCGMTGAADVATAEKGEKMNRVVVQALIEAVQQLDEMGWNYNTTDHATQKLED